MRDEFFWSGFVLVWVFGWVSIWLVRRRIREARSDRQREMLHQERLAAIEKGVPLPEIPDLAEAAVWLSAEGERFRASWARRLSLLLGLVGVTTGLGLCAAFFWAPDRGYFGMWTLGLVPFSAGIGFLLFYLIASVTDPGDLDR